MKRVISGLVAVIGLIALAESLSCNQCSLGLIGFCLKPSTTVCSTNTSQCFTGKAMFPSISGFSGFSTQGCLEVSQCNSTFNGTIFGASYSLSQTCCNTDNCNPVTISSAPYSHSSTLAALSTTLLAFICTHYSY